VISVITLWYKQCDRFGTKTTKQVAFNLKFSSITYNIDKEIDIKAQLQQMLGPP